MKAHVKATSGVAHSRAQACTADGAPIFPCSEVIYSTPGRVIGDAGSYADSSTETDGKGPQATSGQQNSHLDQHTLDQPLAGKIDGWPVKLLAGDDVIQAEWLLEAALHHDAGLPAVPCKQVFWAAGQALHVDQRSPLEQVGLKGRRPATSPQQSTLYSPGSPLLDAILQ